jgi:hypothetical protein
MRIFYSGDVGSVAHTAVNGRFPFCVPQPNTDHCSRPAARYGRGGGV